jgi:release factor glutamine methyltransferase
VSGENERVVRALAEGRVTFLDLELRVAPGALVPRDETELLARTAITSLFGAPGDVRVVDMCCGSGNLACAIARYVPYARVWASDLTDACVAVARDNVRALGLEDRVTVRQGDLFAGLAADGLEGTLDLIVCNPPYISTGKLDKDKRELIEREPREAFDGGPYGLTIHQRVIKEAPVYLAPKGQLMFEIGLGQERQVEILLKRSSMYDGVEQRKDAAGNVRVVIAKKR